MIMPLPGVGAALRCWRSCCSLLLAVMLLAPGLAVKRSFAETESLRLRIGVLTPLTGQWAQVGEMMVKGAELAVQERASAHGAEQIELLVEDTDEAVNGAKAVSAYRSLRRRGIDIFVGPLGAPGGLAIAPLLRKDPDVVMVTPAVGVKDFSEASPNAFNVRGVDEFGTRSIARYVFTSGARKIAVFSSQQGWELIQGRAFADEFGKAGGQVSVMEEPLPTTSDLRGEALRIVKAAPDAVFFSNQTQFPIAIKEVRRLGYAGPAFAAGVALSQIPLAKEQMQGTRFAAFAAPTAAFAEKFQSRFKAPPGFSADTAYDAVWALAQAAQLAKSAEPKEIIRALRKVSFAGASGVVEFDQSRLVKRRYVIRTIVGDGFEDRLE